MLQGDKIGPFVVESELGSGAMGSVYLAQFTQADGSVSPIALKIVALGLLGNDQAMARFDREAAILKQLKHPHIVRLIATGKYRKTPFIAMEYVDGEPLDRMLTRRGRLTWETVVDYGKQLCKALQHAHEKGIIHRDLKPSNLMLTKEGVLKLTDFGIAKDTDVTALTGMNSTIGTAAYMSPEQCKGDKFISNKSDLYSLGIVLYELLTGKKPFVADSTIDMFLKHVNEIPARPAKIIHEIPIWLDNLVMFLMEKDKDRRPLDAATVGRMLEDIEEKVQTQVSAGEVAAGAKKSSRTLQGQTFTQEDRDAARAIKGKKKKKKRAGDPWYTEPWAKALPLIAGMMIVIVGIIFGIKYAGQKTSDTTIVDNSGKSKVVSADEVAGRKWETVLLTRLRTGRFVDEVPSEEKEVNEITKKAQSRELEGQLKQAHELWSDVRKQLDNVVSLNSAAWKWVAEKRIKDIAAVEPRMTEYRKKIADDQILERPWKFNPSEPVNLALLALRYEQFGDPSMSRKTWETLSKDVETNLDDRSLFLMARQQMGPDPKWKPGEAFEKTITNLDKKMVELTKLFAKLDGEAKGDKAYARTCRNAARDIVELYDEEKENLVKQHVARAKELLLAMKE